MPVMGDYELATSPKSQFVEMFGDEPVENGKWKVERLGDCLSSIENGKSFVCSDSKRLGKYPAILKLSAVTYGEYNQYENKALLDESMFVKNVEVKQGDLLFTRKNTPELVGMAAYVFNTERYLMMPDLIFRLNVKEGLNKLYLWKLINHPIFRERIQNLANGSAKSMSNI
jgi:type I restriction enzyme S subunit